MPARAVTRVPLIVPGLGIRDGAVIVSLWLVPRGAAVLAGDRVVELVAGGVTIDLEAPVTGRLVTQHADEDEVVSVGRILAEFEVAE
jgi:pyruvate/2-oxoglutarate dehydrogenase complex dihydrolipoamide acyltransferase (E2) component